MRDSAYRHFVGEQFIRSVGRYYFILTDRTRLLFNHFIVDQRRGSERDLAEYQM